MRFVYLIGPPAAGKSHLMRRIISTLPPGRGCRTTAGLRYSRHGDQAIVLGTYRPTEPFPGLDRLPRSIGPHFRAWLAQQARTPGPHPTIWAEGERLMNGPSLDAIRQLAALELYLLQPSAQVLADRHRQRNDTQSATWLKGMATRVERIARDYGARPIQLLPEYKNLT